MFKPSDIVIEGSDPNRFQALRTRMCIPLTDLAQLTLWVFPFRSATPPHFS